MKKPSEEPRALLNAVEKASLKRIAKQLSDAHQEHWANKRSLLVQAAELIGYSDPTGFVDGSDAWLDGFLGGPDENAADLLNSAIQQRYEWKLAELKEMAEKAGLKIE